MFVKFSRAVVLAIVGIMLASFTEASPMPTAVTTHLPTTCESIFCRNRYLGNPHYFSGTPGTSITVNCQTCVCQENGGMLCDEIICVVSPPAITDIFVPSPTA
ncbi:hypothetical protein C8R45DRAFT_495950 [Mycena sanguinolenta]|nr:hypothetical protein C8R45DRAFT_495950 [Mycena sanguinolenta]